MKLPHSGLLILFVFSFCTSGPRKKEALEILHRPSVVVWPFSNHGPAEMQGTGPAWAEVTETMLHALSDVDVIPGRLLAALAMELTGSNPPESTLIHLSRTLGADYLITGSYQLERATVVLKAQVLALNSRVSGQRLTYEIAPDALHTIPVRLLQDFARVANLPPAPELETGELKPFQDFADAMDLSRTDKGAAYELLKKEQTGTVLAAARDFSISLYFELFHSAGAYQMIQSWKNDAFRSQRPDLARNADWLEHFGRQRLLELRYKEAGVYLDQAEEILKARNLQMSLLHVRYLEARGSLAYREQNRLLAFSYFKNAEEILARLGRHGSLFHIKNLIGAGSVYAAGDQYDLSQRYFAQARTLLEKSKLKESSLYATVLYNLGNLRLFQGDFDGALQFYDEARDVLLYLGLANSRLYLMITANMGAAFFAAGDMLNAINYLDRAVSAAPALGFRRESLYRDIRYNLVLAVHAYADSMAGKALRLDELDEASAERARSQFKRDTVKKLLPAFMLNDSIGLPLMQLVDCALPFEMPVKNDIFRTGEEYRTVRGYTGQYSLSEQRQEVKTRTFDGRLDDTNVMLKDLLNPDLPHREIRFLRSILLRGDMRKQSDGTGMVFVDIGPAVAHARFPAITSRNIARDFPAMKVVALDLPQQMLIYRRHIPVYLKKQIQAQKNLFFLKGDGVKSISEQMQEKENWIFDDREPFELGPTETLIVRAANSLDIYVHWSEVEPAIRRLARDFEQNPVLLFFNRGILVKPAGSVRFDVVGYISIRGFHHYMNTLDREGEEPYRLFNLVDD